MARSLAALVEQKGDAVGVSEALGLDEFGDLVEGLLAVFKGAGLALDELDDVVRTEGIAVVGGHADQQGLGEGGVDAELEVFRFGVGE